MTTVLVEGVGAVRAWARTAQTAKTASAFGIVESIDAGAGKITLAHGPVDALGWPAMTMGFTSRSRPCGPVSPCDSSSRQKE